MQIPLTGDGLPSRMHFVDFLRAAASTVIAWHHFAFYGPLSDYAMPVAGDLIRLLANYGRATPVFFVVGGYVMTRSMAGRTWSLPQVGRYIIHRYCRLGIPYLVATVLAIAACQFGRGSLPSEVVDPQPTWPAFLAHVFFLQKILGYDSFSAGQWFVCVIFQLSIVFVLMLFLRDRLARWFSAGCERATVLMLLCGGIVATSSLFYFNVGDTWNNWFIYFFPQFFLGMLVFYGLQNKRAEIPLWLYLLLVVAALFYTKFYLNTFRWPLFNALLTGLILIGAGKSGIMERWPKSRVIAYLGQTSYSLFLIHFAVLVVVATVWVQVGWTRPMEALTGLVVAYLLSVAASAVFYHYVEVPADLLSRRFNWVSNGDVPLR